MSDRTAPSLALIDQLTPLVQTQPASPSQQSLLAEIEALRRAVAAFHMEAIRFRMYNVERQLRSAGASAETESIFAKLRDALEAAGFHTRSHSAP